MAKLSIQWLQPDYGFEATDENGLKVRYDNAPGSGGQLFGISPMKGLLMSLCTCSGIDVVLILNKKRQEITSFSIEVDGEREENKVPALWQKAHMKFILTGAIEEAKAIRAIELSINNYCSVAETLRRAGCAISWELALNQ